MIACIGIKNHFNEKVATASVVQLARANAWVKMHLRLVGSPKDKTRPKVSWTSELTRLASLRLLDENVLADVKALAGINNSGLYTIRITKVTREHETLPKDKPKWCSFAHKMMFTSNVLLLNHRFGCTIPLAFHQTISEHGGPVRLFVLGIWDPLKSVIILYEFDSETAANERSFLQFKMTVKCYRSSTHSQNHLLHSGSAHGGRQVEVIICIVGDQFWDCLQYSIISGFACCAYFLHYLNYCRSAVKMQVQGSCCLRHAHAGLRA